VEEQITENVINTVSKQLSLQKVSGKCLTSSSGTSSPMCFSQEWVCKMANGNGARSDVFNFIVQWLDIV